ncbi:MAG: hypothetical protein V2I82_05155 [Halieaceae bacterium]|jgi:hypothetical protein|nr:hypothetical protein [Halieaceae bacterium]
MASPDGDRRDCDAAPGVHKTPAQNRPSGPASTAARGKASLRRELADAVDQYLSRGGQVSQVPSGASAWEPGTRPPPSRPLFSEPADPRTPVSDVVARLEARREAMKARRAPRRRERKPRPRRRIIYDDFGEPLRHVWEDD